MLLIDITFISKIGLDKTIFLETKGVTNARISWGKIYFQIYRVPRIDL